MIESFKCQRNSPMLLMLISMKSRLWFLQICAEGAIDNIDHNPSSLTSHGSFHGTGISIFQYPTIEQTGDPCQTQQQELPRPKKKSVSELPEFYANVPPAVSQKKPLVGLPPLLDGFVPLVENNCFNKSKEEELKWLNYVQEEVSNQRIPSDVSWGAYHSLNLIHDSDRLPSVTSLLPLFSEQAKSVAMIKHCITWSVGLLSISDLYNCCRSTAILSC